MAKRSTNSALSKSFFLFYEVQSISFSSSLFLLPPYKVGSIGPKPCAAIASCNFKAAYPDYREQVVEISVLLIGVFVVCLKCFRKV